MSEERIVITIDNNGGLTAKTSGFKGETCVEALSELLDLGDNCTQFKKTDAYYQKQQTVSVTTQKTKVR